MRKLEEILGEHTHTHTDYIEPECPLELNLLARIHKDAHKQSSLPPPAATPLPLPMPLPLPLSHANL